MVGLGLAAMENIGYYIGALVRPEVGGVKPIRQRQAMAA